MDARVLFTKMATDRDERGVTTGEVFGCPALVRDGRAFACLVEESMAFRLGAGSPHQRAALALPGAGLLDPAHTGAGDPDWVAVPVAECNEWERLADEADAALG